MKLEGVRSTDATMRSRVLVFQRENFAKGVTHAVMGGWGTDCNGATVGSMVGAMSGGKGAPEFWTGRLNDTLMADIPGYHPLAISECARRAVEIARNAVT